jgi:general L-amino acid transport system substrate-binding protein
LAETIIYRGTLGDQKVRCGLIGDLPGFSSKNGLTHEGMYADFCKAIALTLFGRNENSVEFITYPNVASASDAVRLDKADVVFATTSTFNRDVGERIDFGATIFHDGQGIVVRREAGIASIADLNNKSICVVEDTTSLLNLPDITTTYSITVTRVLNATLEEAFVTLSKQGCDAVTDIRSALAATRVKLNLVATDYPFLGGSLSREPLSPFFRENDSRWAEVINSVINCAIGAEELGVYQNDVPYIIHPETVIAIQDAKERERISKLQRDSRVRRLLGLAGGRINSSNPGLLNDYCQQIIGELGNYKQIYTRNLLDTHILDDLEPGDPEKRGPNKAWNIGQGGVLSAPPFR